MLVASFLCTCSPNAVFTINGSWNGFSSFCLSLWCYTLSDCCPFSSYLPLASLYTSCSMSKTFTASMVFTAILFLFYMAKYFICLLVISSFSSFFILIFNMLHLFPWNVTNSPYNLFLGFIFNFIIVCPLSILPHQTCVVSLLRGESYPWWVLSMWALSMVSLILI